MVKAFLDAISPWMNEIGEDSDVCRAIIAAAPEFKP